MNDEIDKRITDLESKALQLKLQPTEQENLKNNLFEGITDDVPTGAVATNLKVVWKKQTYYIPTGQTNAGGVVTLTDGATVDLDASLGKVFYLSAGGDRTINTPTNPSDAKVICIRHFANGGARTLSLDAGGFRFGSTVTGLSQTVSGKTDYIVCIWNEIDSIFDVVEFVKGY